MDADPTAYPWSDTAVAVGNGEEGFSEVLAEGTLLQVADWLKGQPASVRKTCRISLPDRGARPFNFRGDAISTLVVCAPWLAPSDRLATR